MIWLALGLGMVAWLGIGGFAAIKLNGHQHRRGAAALLARGGRPLGQVGFRASSIAGVAWGKMELWVLPGAVAYARKGKAISGPFVLLTRGDPAAWRALPGVWGVVQLSEVVRAPEGVTLLAAGFGRRKYGFKLDAAQVQEVHRALG